jgi:hypothetical protein
MTEQEVERASILLLLSGEFEDGCGTKADTLSEQLLLLDRYRVPSAKSAAIHCGFSFWVHFWISS